MITLFPKLIRVAFFVIIMHLLIVTIFAAIRYPIMNSNHYIISPKDSNINRAALCMYQSVLTQSGLGVEVTPISNSSRAVLAIQSFLSFLCTSGGLVLVFDWIQSERDITTFT